MQVEWWRLKINISLRSGYAYSNEEVDGFKTRLLKLDISEKSDIRRAEDIKGILAEIQKIDGVSTQIAEHWRHCKNLFQARYRFIKQTTEGNKTHNRRSHR